MVGSLFAYLVMIRFLYISAAINSVLTPNKLLLQSQENSCIHPKSEESSGKVFNFQCIKPFHVRSDNEMFHVLNCGFEIK